MERYKKFKIFLLTICALAALLFSILYLFYHDVGILNPKGWVAVKERNLLVISTLLMLIVVLPVLFFIFAFAWKYRASNKQARYEPNWDYNFVIESIWWGIPIVIIVILSILTWISTYQLDPYKSLASRQPPLTIQVVALQWRWLFIYPEQKIATLNFVRFPEKTPIHFVITADAPMNSFWIPELSGQIFAMPKMRTELNIVADEIGSYRGCSANISGTGFANMNFMAHAVPAGEFASWIQDVQKGSHPLTRESYQEIAQPNEAHDLLAYNLQDEELFNHIVMKYMMPPTEPGHEMESMPKHHME